MKLYPILITIICILFLSRCDFNGSVNPEESQVLQINPLEDEVFVVAFQDLVESGEINSSIVSVVDLTTATKVIYFESDVTTYSLRLFDPFTLKNLLITVKDDNYYTKTLEFIPTKKEPFDLTNFTGKLVSADLNGQLNYQISFVDGESSTSQEISNSGRVESTVCEAYGTYVISSYYVSVNVHGWTCYDSGESGDPGAPSGYEYVTIGSEDRDIYHMGGGSSSSSWPTGFTLFDVPFSAEIPDIQEYLECFNISSSATLTLYVDQPKPGTRKTWAGNPLFGTDNVDVGHTFIGIEQGGIKRYFGFYPDGGVDPKASSPSNSGAAMFDSSHTWDVSVSTTISGSQLSDVIDYVVDNASSTYNLETYNCTDFAISTYNKSGAALPDSYGSWPGGGGSNPGDLGEDLRSYSKTGHSVDTSKGKAGADSGSC